MLTRTQARKSGMVEIEQPVDGPFGVVPPVRPPLEAAGKLESSLRQSRLGPHLSPPLQGSFRPTRMGSEADRKASPAGFPLRCPGGQTGPKPSIEEMPRPPSEQGTSSLSGLATDNVGYQTASSGSDEAGTDWLEKYSGGHTPQDHTVAVATVASVAYSQSAAGLNSQQPPALPPGAPTAAAQGLTLDPGVRGTQDKNNKMRPSPWKKGAPRNFGGGSWARKQNAMQITNA